MRFSPNGRGICRPSWGLVLILLTLSVVPHGADPAVEGGEAPPAEHGEGGGGEPWEWSAGGWFSLGGWSTSWRSLVSGTRSMFRWRFGNVPPEDSAEDEGPPAEGVAGTAAPPAGGGGPCEPLELQMCRDLGYDATSVPNLLNHESQDIARVELQQYEPLVRVNCSSDMAFFLCALHAPRCSPGGGGGGRPLPCRPVCQRIKSQCDVVMERFGFTWPGIFECEKYPEQVEGSCTGQ